MKRRKVGGKAAEAEMRNAAKTLLANIRFAGVDSPIRTVVVTSSVPDEGKSTVSVALAEAMAELIIAGRLPRRSTLSCHTVPRRAASC